MEDKNADAKLALEEMRFNMEKTLEASDALDQRVSIVLAAAGLVLTLATPLQITLSPNRSDLYWAVLLSTIGLFIVAFALALWGASPKEYRLAIASTRKELESRLLDKSEREAILVLLSGYVEQIQHNQRVNSCKANILRFSMLVLLITILALMALPAIP
jgi:uncharacterized membrane protein